MEATKGNIHLIFNGFKQFIIPAYQRIYSWQHEQCERLWKDIVSMQTKDKTGHFVGSIVNVAEQAMPTGIQKFMIIDGQQRMTTLTLLLIALRDYAEQNPNDTSINAPMITSMCLKNDYQQGEDRFKLLLTQTDKETLKKLIEHIPLDDTESNRIINNYNYFFEQIKKGELSPIEIYESIGKLQIVNITLDRYVDDPQLIFESLNSTGMDLSQSDLIRNYVLMGLDSCEQLLVYENIWLPMEKLFGYDKQSEYMDKFFRDYLTMKNGRIPNINKVYEDLKQYHINCGFPSIREFAEEVFVFAKYYTELFFCKSPIPRINKIFSNIKSLQMDVAHPFLLKATDDYCNKVITLDEYCEILCLCENYVFRRAICGIPTNSLNKTFATLKNDIKLDDYLNSVKAYFVFCDSYKEFPSDNEFKAAFIIKDIYNMRIRNYIFEKLESYNNKTPIEISNYTIEHIMPQNNNLSEEWQLMLGENWRDIQKTYLHTIGNLTLTAYNPEMSDKPFDEKLNMAGGFKESALRINRDVINQTSWNKENIENRATQLCELAKNIWSYPAISEITLGVYKPHEKQSTQYSLESYEFLNAYTQILFGALNKRILNLSSDVKREFKKLYIAFKADTNFVDVVIQKSKLRLAINMKFSQVDDPKGICKDITGVGRWGNGDVEIFFESLSQLDDIMEIITQSYNAQVE